MSAVNRGVLAVYFRRSVRHQVTAFTILLACGTALGVASSEVRAAPPSTRVGPEIFGRVFRAAKRSMLRVRTNDAKRPFATGFFIGARGELLFGSRGDPGANIAVITREGERRATLLAFDSNLGLAVARLDGEGVSTEPLHVLENGALAIEQWVVTVRHDKRGAPEPFAGVVDTSARQKKLGKATAQVAHVAAPGARGSPVLTLDGALIGVVIEEGERRSGVVLVGSIVPFLRSAVLGE
jgi:hypothetical protein